VGEKGENKERAFALNSIFKKQKKPLKVPVFHSCDHPQQQNFIQKMKSGEGCHANH